MSGERVDRRLAAILAADVVGYSRVMGQDEAVTLARLRGHRRELIDPSIAKNKGRIVKTTGDSILIEFPSVVEAVGRTQAAAILAADVAGYSRLMGADEEGTLGRLKAHRRELIDLKIKEHRGRNRESPP